MNPIRPDHRLALPGLFLLVSALAAPAQDSQKARLRVLLPKADVELEIQGVRLQKKNGVEFRLFESPPLEPGKKYVYDIRAAWMEKGKPVIRERSVKVMAGKTAEVDLRVENDNSPDVVPAKSPSPMPDKPMTEKPAASNPPDKPMTEKPLERKPVENYLPTPVEVVAGMLEMTKARGSDVVFVVGCNDGRIANTAAVKAQPKKVIGVDSNSDRLATARKNASEAKVADRVEFRLGDPTKITDKDLADSTVILIDNLVPKQLSELTPVLRRLKPGARIAVHNFEIPGMKYSDKREIVVNEVQYVVYLYELK
jgi:uncharacterized protein (TIGR03000 family)